MLQVPVFLDTETTATKNNEPVEISYIVADHMYREVQHYINPTEECLPVATVCHGLTADFLSHNGLNIEENLLEAVSDLLDNQNKYCIIGYNIGFDIKVINDACKKYLMKEFKPITYIDIMKLAKKVIPRDVLGSYSLDCVYYHLMPEKLDRLLEARSSHSALVDSQLTKELYYAILPVVFGDDIPDLDSIMDKAEEPNILKVWPFGKHKGDDIIDVYNKDRQYMNWFMYKCDFKDSWGDLVHTLEEKFGYHK